MLIELLAVVVAGTGCLALAGIHIWRGMKLAAIDRRLDHLQQLLTVERSQLFERQPSGVPTQAAK